MTVRSGPEAPKLRRGAATFAVLLLASLAVLPGSATARAPGRPGRVAGRPEPGKACPIAHVELSVTYYCQFEFAIPASNGYRISVVGEPDSPGVELTATGRSGSVNYFDRKGKVTASSISASFGAVGRISMKFQPTGKIRERHLSKQCFPNRPRSVGSQLGEFVGSFKFRGEQDYARAVAHHAAGGLGDPLTNGARKSNPCEFRESAAERKREDRLVALDVSAKNPSFFFSATELTGQLRSEFKATRARPYVFLAGATEHSGAITILRTAGTLGARDEFSFDDELTQATVSPSAPFAGSASFQRQPDGTTSWTGDLSVALPGLGRISLARGKAELATVGEHLKHLEEELTMRPAE